MKTTRYFVFPAIALAVLGCSAAADPGNTGSQQHGDVDGSPGDDGGSQAQGDSGTVLPGVDSGMNAADSSSGHDGSGMGPGDGGGPHDGGTLPPDGGVGGFGATCTPQNNQCPTAYPVCFAFNGRGDHCTKQCASAADCPGGAGGLGCSGMGVCKVQ